MAELLTQPKKHLALDTDWQTALGMAAFFFICAVTALGSIRMALQGSFSVPDIGWATPLLAVACLYFACATPDRLLRLAAVVFAVGPISRTMLWLLHASKETQLINLFFVRWIDLGLFLGGCVYAIYWFRKKVTYV